MLIKSFSYHDKLRNWKLEKVDFQELTLLVGASGVGKTKILKALENLKRIAFESSFLFMGFGDDLKEALGNIIQRISWNLEFEEKDRTYIWQGETDYQEDNAMEFERFSLSKDFSINSEKLTIESEQESITIFERNKNQIVVNGKESPKITQSRSCMDIFSSEDSIKKAVEGLEKMLFFHFEEEKNQLVSKILEIDTFKDFNVSLDSIKKSNLSTVSKLVFVYTRFPSKFLEIKKQFIEVFPYVTDVAYKLIENNKWNEQYKDDMVYELHIKEEDRWISKNDISSGMLKTLLFISMLHLSPEGSVIFVDEFENSLGINCIDILSSIASSTYSNQLILTSHHPYIINNISMNNWKIVSRKGGTVVVKSAEDYDLGKSKHKAFMQLLNLEAYREGRDSD